MVPYVCTSEVKNEKRAPHSFKSAEILGTLKAKMNNSSIVSAIKSGAIKMSNVIAQQAPAALANALVNLRVDGRVVQVCR